MIDAVHIATSGLTANQSWIDSISNNVANMQTTAFKRSQVNFQSIVKAQGGLPAAPLLPAGAGVALGQATIDFSPGAMRATNLPYDLAIQGNGFFEVALASGETLFTRVGNFRVNAQGQLALPGGEVLAGDILIPPDVKAVQIQADGVVKARLGESGELQELGMLRLAMFAQPAQLESVGNGLYRAGTAAGAVEYRTPGEEGAGLLLQGQLEVSNVDLVSEMTDLVLAQRAYQLNARILQTSDQVLETINNLRR